MTGMDGKKRLSAVYRCRHCGAVYKVGSFDAANLSVCQLPMGLYQGERIPPTPVSAAMVDIHTCDGCVPRFGIGELLGWE